MSERSKVLVSVVRLPLLFDMPDTDRYHLNKLMWGLQREVRVAANRAIDLCKEYSDYSSEYKKKHDVYPDASEVLKYKQISGFVYNIVSKECTGLQTCNLSQTLNSVCSKFKNDLPKILSGEMSVPSYRQDIPIDIHNKSTKISKDGSAYKITLSLFSKALVQNNNEQYIDQPSFQLQNGRVNFIMQTGKAGASQKAVLDSCVSGDYKICASKLIYDKKKKLWSLNLTYSFSREFSVRDNKAEKRIMGIDMGITYPVYASMNNTSGVLKINGGEIDRFRLQVESRKRQLQQQASYCGDGRIGHGRATRLKPIEVTKDKIANFRNTINHRYSRRVIDFAVEHNVDVIQIEDLSGIVTDNRFLQNWSYYDLQQKMVNKANAVGIAVSKVNPAYTSKRCSKCGCIDDKNRDISKNQSLFACISCGYKTNADFNASQNLSVEGIDVVIAESLQDNGMHKVRRAS